MGNCQQQANNNQSVVADKKYTINTEPDIKENNNSKTAQSINMQLRKKSSMYSQECPFTFIRRPAPNFTGVSYQGEFQKISLKDFQDQYIILFFFPSVTQQICRDFILEFQKIIQKFQQINCQVIGCSSDSQFVHMNYCQKSIEEGGLGNLNFILLSDVDRQIATSYGVVIDEGDIDDKECNSFRSTFIIDSNLILRHMSINDIAICVNPLEILRLVEIFQQNDNDNPANLPTIQGCPFQNNQQKSQPEIDTFSRYQKKQQKTDNNNQKKRQTLQSDVQPNVKIIEKLGGVLKVQEISDSLVSELFQDSLIKPLFQNTTNQKQHRLILNSFLLTYFGGTEQYYGRSLKESHQNLSLNDEHFNKFVEIFKKILKDLNYTHQVIQEVVCHIEPLRSQIVQKPISSLFQRCGGEDGIRKAINTYFEKILNINEIKPYFNKIDLDKTKESYTQYLALSFGGPQKYAGKQLRQAHTPYHIHDKLFSYCVIQIQQAFKDNGLDLSSVNEIGRLLECLRSEIPKKNNTLFDRLGGYTVLQNSTSNLYNQKIPQNEKLKEFFKTSNMPELAQKMCDFYTMITGGPFQYNGKSVKEAHKNFYITSLQYDAYKMLLKECIEQECKNKDAISEFINLLETIKIDVMGGKPPSLFEKMGGDEQVNIFTETFFLRIMNEKRIKHYFLNVDLKKLKHHFKDFLAMGMGGHGKKYNGENVRDLHQQMDLRNKEFDIFKELIILTTQDQKYPPELQTEIANFFESMRLMIVCE